MIGGFCRNVLRDSFDSLVAIMLYVLLIDAVVVDTAAAAVVVVAVVVVVVADIVVAVAHAVVDVVSRHLLWFEFR